MTGADASMGVPTPPPQLASNIPTATESATEKQVVGACAPMNEYPQRRGFAYDVSVWQTSRIAQTPLSVYFPPPLIVLDESLWKPVAATGVAEVNRYLIADQVQQRLVHHQGI